MKKGFTSIAFARKGFTKGFTLIELLVVVLIIGILAAIAVPQYQKAVMKSRLTEVKTTLSSLAKATAVCKLAGAGTYAGGKCIPIDLDVTFSGTFESDGHAFLLKNAFYMSEYNISSIPEITATVLYNPEDVCVCNHTTKGLVMAEEKHCWGGDHGRFSIQELSNMMQIPTDSECICC